MIRLQMFVPNDKFLLFLLFKSSFSGIFLFEEPISLTDIYIVRVQKKKNSSRYSVKKYGHISRRLKKIRNNILKSKYEDPLNLCDESSYDRCVLFRFECSTI